MNRLGSWFRSLPPVVLLTAALVVSGLFVAGSVMAYRTYDYIEHDNDFCMSCHLMAEPYELFAESAHRDLGCKACHKPSFAGRSQMALTQVLESPDTIAAHAEVPNEKCASCHIDGNPEDWVLVANSAGHRVHFESEDPELDGLLCVQCHSSSLHQFAATDETCAQSGCHTDVEVKLGRMGDLTIHCAACHGFNAVVEEGSELEVAQAAVAPGADECLSCHVMRTLVDMPPDEPHEKVCSTCHNPHEQETPQEAVETCATVGCHNDVRELSPFHRGLDHTDVEDCSTCHVAHDWKADGDNCLSCHQDIYDDPGLAPGQRIAMSPAEGVGGDVVVGAHATGNASASAPSGLPYLVGLGGGLHPGGYLHAGTLSPATQEAQESRRPFLATGDVVFRVSPTVAAATTPSPWPPTVPSATPSRCWVPSGWWPPGGP
ncbi:MAG: hypothetical protein P8188_04575 [Gemmatimonadota bacterium]